MIGFNGPIPGQSLTVEPKKFPWERPPEFVDPEDAIRFHLDRMMNPEFIDSILDMLQDELFDVHTLTKGILRSAVSRGLYTIDVAMIIGPVIHEFIKQAAEAADIEYNEGIGPDPKEQAKKKRERENTAARAALKKMGYKPAEAVEGIDTKEVEKPANSKAKGKGLMSFEDGEE